MGNPHWPIGWSPSGEAAYYFPPLGEGYNIVRVPFDPEEGILSRDRTVVYRLGNVFPGAQTPGAEEGTLVYIGGLNNSNLKAIDLRGAPEATDYSTSMVTSGTASNNWPVLDLDGRTVIFTRIEGETGTDIYRQPTDGGAEELIRPSGGLVGVIPPALSRDGNRLAFYEMVADGPTTLVVMNLANGREAELPLAGGKAFVGWSPDGQQLAAIGFADDRLTLVNPRDSSATTVEPQCDPRCTFGTLKGPPVYSPEGNRIAISGEDGLWIVTVPDGGSVRITEGFDWPLSWTEGWIYFSRAETAGSGRDSPVIFRIPPEGGTPELYARLPEDCNAFEVALSLDASMAVCAVKEERADVHIVENFDGGRR